MDYAKESLRLHYEWKGKLEVTPRAAVDSKDALSLAYTPGVAQPCLEIQKDVNKSYELTRRWNTVAVVTDGTAVLGLGDIGPEAGMPVMEGKCVLFKAFGDVDAIPLCIRSKDVDEIVNTVALLAGSFGGVNLEDIAAPRCFEIEKKLKERCDIPIFHDDQHGTAVLTLAGLRGLRLTSPAKRLLLADAPQWFSDYLTGSSEPNKLKSELSRRLRLHRMAEILTIMHNADIPAFPWEKAPFSAMVGQNAESPAYYTSREIKEIGPQGTKIRGSRATGILLTDGGIFLTYNTAKAQMKWEYKAELRFKALLQTGWVMPDTEISGIVFGSAMEQLPILMQPDAHSYFLLDGSFPHFYYLTNDRYGEAILRLLCDAQHCRTLDAILADGLYEQIPNWLVENDAVDSAGNPVLFAYTCDFPRVRRFDTALELHGMTGTLICFDYQEDALREICGHRVTLQSIDFQQFERSLPYS